MWEFVADRHRQILSASWQHFSLVAQCLLLATLLAIIIAALVYRSKTASAAANSVTAIGLTIPSFAMIGLLIAPLGFGVPPAVVVVSFFAILPILRNVVVGLDGVPGQLVESARGMGMNPVDTFVRVRLPLAWPVILTGVRVSTQMSMGVAAIAAYALGPGLGGYIFTGLSQIGGANAVSYALVGTVGIVLLALLLDALLVLVGRLTIPKGIRS